MSNKDANLKEKLKQALESTFKVISDDFKIDLNSKQNKKNNKIDFFELDKLNTKSDFIKARAETDSSALKKNFQMMIFLKKTYHRIVLVNHYTQ
tara:strand:+ start:829 stop:1110 length:282 start_codon:yes stop_codon:yes gene_type:complete